MSTTPDQLTMGFFARRRVIDSSPPDKFLFQYDDFLTETYESSGTSTTVGGYLPFGTSPTTGGSWGLAGNSTFGITAGGSGFNSYFDARARPPLPEAYIETQAALSAQRLSIGFVSSNGNDYILGTVNSSGNYEIISEIGGSSSTVNSSIAAGSTPQFRLVLNYPEAWLYANTAQGWIPVCFVYLAGVGTTDDLRISSVWSTWAPVFGGNLAANASVQFDYIKVGMPPAYASRDYKPIMYRDGTHVQVEGRYYFTMTAANGQDFATNHMTIMSIDPDIGDPRVEGHLFFDIVSGGVPNTTALYAGSVVYDPNTSTFYVFPCSWGFGGVSSGVDEWLAVTKKYILSGVHVLSATMLNLPNSTGHSYYDGHVRWDPAQGLWIMACIETGARTSWTTNYPTIFTSPDLETWTEGTPYTTDGSLKIDGTAWARMSGQWYVFAGGNDNYHCYTYNASNQSLSPIANLSTFQSNWQNFAGTPVSFSGFVPHLIPFPVFDDGQTQWMALTYDSTYSNPPAENGGSLPASPGTGGAMIILRATATVAGDEFAMESFPVNSAAALRGRLLA